MIDHLGFPVRDLARSKAFFTAALAPLGIGVVMEVTAEQTGGPVHVAFTAGTRDVVQRFHRAAIAAGGIDNGGPGLRPHYHPDYYGAFVLDPDGNNVEAVCHAAA